MANTRGNGNSLIQSGKGGVVEGKAGAVLKQLVGRFEAFRGTHRSRARIPETLRAAVLAAIAQGADALEVMRCCRITEAQLARWRDVDNHDNLPKFATFC